MFILIWKKPTAIHDGKSGYVMTWRGKQLAMCADAAPLQAWIDQQENPDSYYIEEYPCKEV